MIPQISAIKSPTCQQSASMVPTPDATDFPPVKPRKIDFECPINTATAASTASIPVLVSKYLASKTGNAPLNASISITPKNHPLPRTLLTFVAPVEPEPILRMSSPLSNFTTIYPVGIEPMRYATKNVIITGKIKLGINLFPFVLVLLVL